MWNRPNASQRRLVTKHLPALAPPAPPRPVGRPKVVRKLDDVLSDTAAAAAAADEPAKRAKHYTKWLESPYINDILNAFKRTGSARRALTLLLREAPDSRYEHLSHNTIGNWFDERGQLLPKVREQLSAKPSRGVGSARTFANVPAVEDEIKRHLLLMREAGTPINSRIIRWVMVAVCTKMKPSLLEEISFSQQFISSWVRQQLSWRWRARTTTASKLPLDWAQQGIEMARRVAANMEMHKVSHTVTAYSGCPTPTSLLTELSAVLLDTSLSRHQHGSNRSSPRAHLSLHL
jgi:hypothetical protein